MSVTNLTFVGSNMADGTQGEKLVNSVAITLIARFAIIFASVVGVPMAVFLITRSISSQDKVIETVSAIRDQGIETAGALRLIKQSQEWQASTINDHESRLRKVEDISRSTARN